MFDGSGTTFPTPKSKISTTKLNRRSLRHRTRPRPSTSWRWGVFDKQEIIDVIFEEQRTVRLNDEIDAADQRGKQGTCR